MEQRKIWSSGLKNKVIWPQAKGSWNPPGARGGVRRASRMNGRNSRQKPHSRAPRLSGNEKETEQRNPFYNTMGAWLYASLNSEKCFPYTYCLGSQEVLSVSSGLGSIFLSHSPACFLSSLSPVPQLHKVSFACLLTRSPKYPVVIIQVPLKRRATG